MPEVQSRHFPLNRGQFPVVVQTGPQALTSNFLVQAPPPPPTPFIWYESPSSGLPGQTFTITFLGSNTHWDPNPTTGTQLTGLDSSITLNTFQITSPTTALANITISTTAPASTSDLTLTTNTVSPAEVDNAQFSVVIAQPTLSIVDPGTGMQGAQNLNVNILGQYTHWVQGTTTFDFGPGITVGSVTILGSDIASVSISVDQLATLGGRSVIATTGGTQVGGAGFTVTPSLALIKAITPNLAKQGDTITVDVTGQNTHWNGSTTFNFGAGIVVTNTVVNSTTEATLTLTVPALAPEGDTYASAQTGGEIATIFNGFVVQAGTPLLLSSGPGSLPQQSTALFTILSQATQWTVNPPTVSFGPGIVVTNVIVTSDTSLTANGYVIPTTYVGSYNLSVSSGTQLLSLPNAIYVSPGPAVINDLSPATANQGANLPAVQINGINTHWVAGTTQLTFPYVLLNSFTVNSPTSITANVIVSPYAPAGELSVTATTLGEIANGSNVFTVQQSQPELLAVVSSSGTQGQSENVTITGAFTHFVAGTSSVTFGPGITVNTVTWLTSSSLQVNIAVQPTATLGFRNVAVTTGTEVVSLTNAFDVTVGPAAISNLNPANGAQDTSFSVAVTGSQTHFSSGVTTAVFGGGINVTGITVTDATHASINITIPSTTPLGTYDVSLTTGGEVATILGGFTVTGGTPQVSAVSPPTGNQGANNLSIALTGLFTHWGATSTASFGPGTVTSLTVSDATHAVATVTISQTATIGSRNVTVTTGTEIATLTGGFSVLAGVPQLTSATPSSAQAGTSATVVIDGEFTSFQSGVSSVTFGSGITVNTPITVNSTTQLTASISVDSNASVGSRDITVTTNSEVVTLSGGFSVTAGTPVITQINPNIGTAGASVAVSITGQYTNWTAATTATFGPEIMVAGAPAGMPGPVTFNSATSITANITINSGATVGPQDVIVTTGAEVETVPGGFTIQPVTIPPPTLLSLSPGAYAGGMPINSSMIAVFSQPMDRTTITTSTVLLYLTSNPGGWISVPGTIHVDATGRVMTFTPNGLLAVNSQYYLTLTNGIKDATGNAFGYYATYINTVFTANATAPTVVVANPQASATGVGTNVSVQLEFSVDMDQSTQSGLTVSTGGTNVPGSFSWNSNPYGAGGYGPGTLLTFTPTSPLLPGISYTVNYGAPLADTAGNALTPGSFTFMTGSGPDTTTNSAGFNFQSNQTNLGTNFIPAVQFPKPINPIDINSGTLLLYNGDSGKYILGTVTVAPNGMSATFAPNYPLLPDTYYRLHMSGGYYDMDGNYLYGADSYFTTGAGSDLTTPTVLSISPANSAINVPLNAEVMVHFSSAINAASVSNAVTVTPSGGSAIAGTATLASDLVTLTFVPTNPLQANTQFAVQVSGYTDMVGNAGTTFNSIFTTASSPTVINVSTGLDATGNLITTNNTNDAHWTYVPVSSLPTPPYYQFSASGTSAPLQVVGIGDAGFYSPWPANGPTSDWININPNSVSGNTLGVYSTTFNIPGPTVPTNLCLAGAIGVDDNGELAVNGIAITSNINAVYALLGLNIPIPAADLVVGSNTLSLGWGSTDNYDEAFRLQAVIETCGASYSNGLSVVSATPAYGSAGAATNTTVTLNFDHPLDPATVSSSTLPVMINWNSNQIVAGSYAVTGSQVIFTPDSPFPVNTSIFVGNCNGPYDIAGETIPSCYSTYLEQFTTGSTAIAPSTPFQIVAFTPAAGASNVGLRAPVTATFNRSVNPSSINSGDFAMFSGDSQAPWCTSYSRSQDNSTLSFNCYPLTDSTSFTAYLSMGLQDWTGDTLPTNYVSQFLTGPYDSNTNGSVITTRPGNGASGISANSPIVIYTNLPINSATASGGLQVAQNNVAVTGTVQVLDNGFTLEFTPSSPFAPGALIQWWTTGSLTDTTYGTYINTTSGYFYVASSTNTLVPAVQVSSPTHGTTTAALNTFVDLQFNTPLNPTTVTATNVYLYDTSTGLNVAGAYSMPQPNEVRIVPSAPLTPNTYIYVYVTTGLQSTTSVPFANLSLVTYFYTGNPADNSLPVVTSAVPFNGSTNVGVNVSPGVIISKPVDPVSVNSNTFQVTNGGTPLAGGFWFNSTNTRVEFVPNAPLPASTNLVMTLNGVLDAVGHPITFTSNFKTGPGPDFTPPTVVWTSVTSNESIPTNSSIQIQFSESMDVTSFGPNNIYIYDTVLGTNVPTTLSWSADQSVAYLTPTSPLFAGRQFYFYVNGGTDLAGNTVSGIEITFNAEFTSASSAPTVIKFNPSSGATGVGTNAIIEAQFSAGIDPNTISGVTLSAGGPAVPTTPLLSAGNTVLQLVPQAPLAPTTSYTMTLAGVKDPAGNLVTTVTNSFTTGTTYDESNATLISSDPPNNSTVGTDVTPKLVFNKPLNAITVSNITFRMFLNDTGQLIPTTLTLSSNGTEVTMEPQIPLLPNTRYHFQACCGYQDQDGNNGYQADLYFNTNGGSVSTAPTVTVSPVNGASGIPLNAEVIVSVSAPIDPTSWTQNSIQLLNGSTPVTGTVTEPDNQTLVFAPSSPLSAGTLYTVKFSGFTDANGNAVATPPTTFTTGSAAAVGGLTFTSSNITFGATGVSATQQIILTFSQILDPTTVNSSTLKVMNTWNSNDALAGTYAVSGNQVTFTPTSPYVPGTSIYVGECGGPTDVLGDVFLNGNCYYQQLVYFTVVSGSPDTTPLQVLSVNPPNGAANVGLDLSVSVTFNKSINPGTMTSFDTQLYAGQDLQTYGSQTLSADGRTMTFNVGSLYNGTTYTVALPAAIGGVGGITDFSGNGLASSFTSTFTTTTDPLTGNGSVQVVRPAANSTGIPTDTLLTLYMNRQVNSATLPGNLTVTVNGQVYGGTVQSTASGYEAQFTPTLPFPNGAVVEWFLTGNVLDVYGDPFYGTSGYFYIVDAVNPATATPQVIAVSPTCCGTTNMPTNGEIDIQYSQPIDSTTLTGNVFFNTPTTPSTATLVSPNVVRLKPNVTLPTPPSSTFYGVCTNSSVKGTNGIAAQGACYATYFYLSATSVADTTPGTVKIGPPDGSVNVGTNATIRLQFSKPVDVTSINSATVQITNGGTAIPGTWSYNYTAADAFGANFSPVNPLPPSSTIKVSVSGLLDYAGNTFASANAQFQTEALPDFSNASVALDFPSGTTGIATNAAFTCRYSKPIDPSSITPSGVYIYNYTTGLHVPAVNYIFSSDLMSVTMETSGLAASTQFYYACQGAIDLTGNAQNGNSVYFITGTTTSSTGPTLVQANPPNSFTNGPVNSNNGPFGLGTSLGLLFSEPVAGNSLSNITLTPNGGSPLAIAVYPEIGNTEVSVQLPSTLQPNTTYTYSISGVMDYNGNAIAPVTSTFKTGSNFAFANPTVTAVTPVNTATGVNATTPGLSITFSEAMNPVLIDTNHIYLRTHNTQTTVPTTITFSADYTTIYLTPVSPLAAATIYDLVTTTPSWYLTDIAGNPFYNTGVESTFTTQ